MLIDDPTATGTFGTIAEYAKEYLPYILQFAKEAWNAWRTPAEETKTSNPMNMNNNNSTGVTVQHTSTTGGNLTLPVANM